ncbi:DLA class II histocompatibility antigen, DR-1 beta chain-like isoform 3-T5 [Dama dama]
MVCLWFPPGSWTVILPVILMVLSPLLAWAGSNRRLFMVQGKSECHFANGTGNVRFLDRYIYNREEQVRFDSLVGEYRARTEMGRPAAERWNRWPDALQRARAAVRTFCASNYRFFASLTVQRRVEPAVTVYPAKTRPLRQHNLLVCSVNGFYPGHVEIMVMLEVVPQGGEVYACHVEHPSLTSPVTVEWRAQDESSREKMLSGIGACVLGLLFLGMGLLFYVRRSPELEQRP